MLNNQILNLWCKNGINVQMRDMKEKLKAPFPWFGGKSKVAGIIWNHLGNVDNYIEPFCGSAAALLARPHAPKIETINDADCYVSNFWRSTIADPEAVAEFCNFPVNECDLHAKHRYLVLSEEAKEFTQKMRTDPEYYNARFAGWWVWGLCCWIGSGWCSEQSAEVSQLPLIGDPPRGGHRAAKLTQQRIHLGADRSLLADESASRALSQQLPAGQRTLTGVHAGTRTYARGQGVHGHDAADTCNARLEWLIAWFSRLRDRLRTVRVCCGDWLRVCDSDSVTTRLGLTGIFFDPPYSAEANRDMSLYAVDCGTVAHDVRAYCLERSSDKRYRIILAGYAGEGHEDLEKHGWNVIAWKGGGGYGNRSEKGKENAKKERLWISPHCEQEPSLFSEEQ